MPFTLPSWNFLCIPVPSRLAKLLELSWLPVKYLLTLPEFPLCIATFTGAGNQFGYLGMELLIVTGGSYRILITIWINLFLNFATGGNSQGLLYCQIEGMSKTSKVWNTSSSISSSLIACIVGCRANHLLLYTILLEDLNYPVFYVFWGVLNVKPGK